MKKLTGYVTFLIFFAQSFAPAQGSNSDKRAASSKSKASLGLMASLNSSTSVNRAIDQMFAPEDSKEIKAFFAGKNERLDVAMSDFPVIGGRVYYGNKFAQVENDGSIRVAGQVVKYNKNLTPKENIKHIYEILLGKGASGESAALRAFLPAAQAQDGINYRGPSEQVLENFPILDKTGLKGIRQQVVVIKDASGKIVRLSVEAVGQTSRSAATWAAARAAAARTTLATAGRAVVAGTAAALEGETAAAVVTLGATAVVVAAVAAAAVYGADYLYTAHYNGTFACSGPDGEGHKHYIFSYTSEKTDWGLRHLDTRIFTADEMTLVFGTVSPFGQMTKAQCQVVKQTKNLSVDARKFADGLDCENGKDILPDECNDHYAGEYNKVMSQAGQEAIDSVKKINRSPGASVPVSK